MLGIKIRGLPNAERRENEQVTWRTSDYVTDRRWVADNAVSRVLIHNDLRDTGARRTLSAPADQGQGADEGNKQRPSSSRFANRAVRHNGPAAQLPPCDPVRQSL